MAFVTREYKYSFCFLFDFLASVEHLPLPLNSWEEVHKKTDPPWMERALFKATGKIPRCGRRWCIEHAWRDVLD